MLWDRGSFDPGDYRQLERRVVVEDGFLEALELIVRLEPELLVQQPPARAEDLERVCLAAAAIEGQHQLAAELLAKRVLAYQPFQLGHELRLPSELEVGGDPLLDRRPPLLLEAAALGGRERAVELCKGDTPPERERLPEPFRRLGRSRTARAGNSVLEAHEVELPVLEPHRVPGRLRDDHISPEHFAELRDVHLDSRRCRLRRLVAPELVDQAVTRNGLVGTEEQERQEPALLGATQLEGPAFVLDFQRSEDAELHALLALF